MQFLPVIILLISSVYSLDEVFSEEPSDNDEITTKSYGMIGDISNKGRRYNVDDTTDMIEEVIKEESILSTDGTEKPPPTPFSRIVRSFDFYDDLYDSYRRKNMKENKNNDPKNVLNDIRSRNSQSNAYNEDQQRRMFFSHIFSLFDDDKKTRRSGKSDDKMKHTKSHIDHEVDTFKSPKVHTEQPTLQKHDSHRKISLKNKDMEPDYDSFESTIESYLNNKRLSNNQYNDENESKHKRKNKGKRQAKMNNSRPERQLDDMERFETVQNKPDDGFLDHEFIQNKMIKNRKRKNTYDDETFDSQTSLINNVVTSTPVSEIVNEMDSSETTYLVRTPSFNYYQTDATYAIPDVRSIKNKDIEPITNTDASEIDVNTDNDADVFEVPDETFNSTNIKDIEESVTSKPDVKMTVRSKQKPKSVSRKELNIPNDDNISEEGPVKVIFEELKNNQSYASDKGSNIVNDFIGKETRRMNYINVNKDMDKEINKPSDISTIKEELETPGEELKVSKVYGQPVLPNVRNPLSARIKLDLLIQLPSQIDVGNDIL